MRTLIKMHFTSQTVWIIWNAALFVKLILLSPAYTSHWNGEPVGWSTGYLNSGEPLQTSTLSNCSQVFVQPQYYSVLKFSVIMTECWPNGSWVRYQPFPVFFTHPLSLTFLPCPACFHFTWVVKNWCTNNTKQMGHLSQNPHSRRTQESHYTCWTHIHDMIFLSIIKMVIFISFGLFNV